MKFILNACINTLPTQDNLKLWTSPLVTSVLCVVTEIARYTHSKVAKWPCNKGDLLGAMTI